VQRNARWFPPNGHEIQDYRRDDAAKELPLLVESVEVIRSRSPSPNLVSESRNDLLYAALDGSSSVQCVCRGSRSAARKSEEVKCREEGPFGTRINVSV